MVGLIILILLALIIGYFVVFFRTAPQLGGTPAGSRLDRIKQSPHYKKGIFLNPVKTDMRFPFKSFIRAIYKTIFRSKDQAPQVPLQTIAFNKQEWEVIPDTETAIAWFGHSSVLIKIDGQTILCDPVFSERVSMFTTMGPKRFEYTSQMSVDQLPEIDLLIISHDHYDHMDYKTLLELKGKVNTIYTALGAGCHLEKWGYSPDIITEFDRWDTAEFKGLKLTTTPTRHFAGRNVNNRFTTHWCGWSIQGKTKHVYFGSDSGYFDGFKEIGEKLPAIDFAMLECGAYNQDWSNIHMFPEETVQAAQDIKTKVLMPIHWAKFTLAFHAWKDPIERAAKTANEKRLPLATPQIGEIFTLENDLPTAPWWESYE